MYGICIGRIVNNILFSCFSQNVRIIGRHQNTGHKTERMPQGDYECNGQTHRLLNKVWSCVPVGARRQDGQNDWLSAAKGLKCLPIISMFVHAVFHYNFSRGRPVVLLRFSSVVVFSRNTTSSIYLLEIRRLFSVLLYHLQTLLDKIKRAAVKS